MKKRFVGFLLVVSIGFGISTFASSVAATSGSITFEDDTDAVKTVDPTDPSKLGKEDPNNPLTNNPGPLSLNVVPLKFDFGIQSSKDSALSYQAKEVGTQFIQLTDNRTDTDGWVLTVQRNELSSKENNELVGAKLSIPKGILRNSLHIPATASAENENLKSYEAEVFGDNTPVIIMSANQILENGKATTVNVWKSSDVSITFKNLVTKKGSYTSTLNWNLLMAPTN